MSVLVCGGAGYIGSHTVLSLLESGREVVIADNFSNSSRKVIDRLREVSKREIALEEVDLCSSGETAALFERHREIDSVIHFAGLKAVGDSVKDPVGYYRCNLLTTLNLLSAMKDAGVHKIVFSSSATVYGAPDFVPVPETAALRPESPYGRSKLMNEEILRDACTADPQLGAVILRYFNPVGAHPCGRIGEDPHGIPNNLMPFVSQVAVGRLPFLRVFGNDYDTSDGTGVRDYIHVCDLAEGHTAALAYLDTHCGASVFNLGTGIGSSVLDVVHAFEQASGLKIPYRITDRRPGDVGEYYADPSLANSVLLWKAKRDLLEMCKDAWNWQTANPNGYKSD